MSGLGLGDYTSSDEEDAALPTQIEAKPDLAVPEPGVKDAEEEVTQVGAKPAELAPTLELSNKDAGPLVQQDETLGPAAGPSRPAAAPELPPSHTDDTPASPYTSTRLMIRNLTMPPNPNFDIPDSPPGSPPAAATAKVAKFLELKKQGVHFNEKLLKSSALRNPGLLQKLLAFAGIEKDEQYATALPHDLAIPTQFPEWAYADSLNKTQQEVTKRREEAKLKIQRDSIDFVPSNTSSRSGTPGVSVRGPRVSTAERIMAGLDREKPRSSQTNDRDGRKRSRSRSPRRKKSRFDR